MSRCAMFVPSLPLFSWLARNPILSFLKFEPKDTITNQLVVGSAVSHNEPEVKREKWSRVREAETRKPTGQIRETTGLPRARGGSLVSITAASIPQLPRIWFP